MLRIHVVRTPEKGFNSFPSPHTAVRLSPLRKKAVPGSESAVAARLAVLRLVLMALIREDLPTPEGPAVTDTLEARASASSSNPRPEFALKHMALYPHPSTCTPTPLIIMQYHILRREVARGGRGGGYSHRPALKLHMEPGVASNYLEARAKHDKNVDDYNYD
jgi:hypothetical protein